MRKACRTVYYDIVIRIPRTLMGSSIPAGTQPHTCRHYNIYYYYMLYYNGFTARRSYFVWHTTKYIMYNTSWSDLYRTIFRQIRTSIPRHVALLGVFLNVGQLSLFHPFSRSSYTYIVRCSLYLYKCMYYTEYCMFLNARTRKKNKTIYVLYL